MKLFVERDGLGVHVTQRIPVDLEDEGEMSERRLDTCTIAGRVGGDHEEPVEPLVPGSASQALVSGPRRAFGIILFEQLSATAQGAFSYGAFDLDARALESGPEP